ncbi:hypothetical protein HDV01_000182 [Terramyces sp. JEL0728]|nr:hypothetical protein HDV01_000182 [Terramyces sp. JEL0728]
MFDYLHELEGVQADYSLISQHLTEELELNQSVRRYDKFAENRLHVYEKDDIQYLAVARKELMNQLCIYKMESLQTITIPKRCTRKLGFNTPIYQIESDSTNIFVRTLEGIHLNRKGTSKYSTLNLNCDLLHFALNPYIKSKVCLQTEDNGVHIWDINTDSVLEWKKGEGEKVWQSARYGPHPQIMYLCDTSNVYIGDLRTASSKQTNLHRIKNGSITGLTKHPSEQFQLAFTTNSKCSVMDSRFTTHPLLEWQVAHGYEHQTHVNYFSKPISKDCSSSFYTWGRFYGDIISFSYDQTDSAPKSVHYQNYESFKSHFLVKDKTSEYYQYDYIPHTWNVDTSLEVSFENPQWDPLLGVEFIQTDNSFTLLQLTATGELFAQGYRYGKEQEYSPADEDRLEEIEQKFKAKIVALNSKINIPDFKATQKELALGNLLNKWQSDLLAPYFDLPFAQRKTKYIPKLKVELPKPKICSKFEQDIHEKYTEIKLIDQSLSDERLPSAKYNFNREYAEHANGQLKKDLELSTLIHIPEQFCHDIVLYGGTDSHSSTITNPILGEKELFGMSSWLLEQWQADSPFEEYEDTPRTPRPFLNKRKEITASNRLSSSQPSVVTSKRSLSQSKSALDIGSSRMALSQPVKSRAADPNKRGHSSQPQRKAKRKKGF